MARPLRSRPALQHVRRPRPHARERTMPAPCVPAAPGVCWLPHREQRPAPALSPPEQGVTSRVVRPTLSSVVGGPRGGYAPASRSQVAEMRENGSRWKSAPPSIRESVLVLLVARVPAWLVALFVVVVDARPEANLRYEPALLFATALELAAACAYVQWLRRPLRRRLGRTDADVGDLGSLRNERSPHLGGLRSHRLESLASRGRVPSGPRPPRPP
jgi:hypothetical protein